VVNGPKSIFRAGILALAATATACATTGLRTSPSSGELNFEEHTLRIPLTVQADGTISLAQSPPLVGRIDLSPILESEGIRTNPAKATVVQLMVHYGRFYVVADGFRSVWEITPRPGATRASYRPIPIAVDPAVQPVGSKPGSGCKPLKGARLSLFGSDRSSCVRLDRANGPPVFITSEAEVANACK
jgi:hypothetical protein